MRPLDAGYGGFIIALPAGMSSSLRPAMPPAVLVVAHDDGADPACTGAYYGSLADKAAARIWHQR
jgi:hypothetical protein